MTGVYFIDPAVTDATISTGIQNTIVASNGDKRVTVTRTGQLAVKATESDDYFHMYNVKFVTGMTSGNMLGANGDDAYTFVFDAISFENCEFEVPQDMNFMYAKYNIASFSMIDCDIKLHANTAEKFILSTNTNNETAYALTFKNNIFYCTDGNVTGYQVFKNTNATISSLEVSKNTFAKVYAKSTNGYFAAKHVTTANVAGNLFYLPDYVTLVADKYIGIIYATDTNKGSVGADAAAANSAGFTFTSNLAYYNADALPNHRLKCSYYANDATGNLYNKFGADNPIPAPDFENGVFTPGENYTAYGAQR